MLTQTRFLLRRILILRPSKAPSSTRFFTRHRNLLSTTRPQLPFLTVPLKRNGQFRYLTTERKRWLAYEVFLGLKYTVYIWAIGAFLMAGFWSLQQEWLERRYPSPHEWRFLTRLRFRLLMWGPDRTDTIEPNWVQIGEYAKNVLSRLEDPNLDGAEVQDLADGPVYIDGIGKSGYNITAKSENWRRGYYEVLMICAKAAENLDYHVLDKERNIVFPKDQVLGPSNPKPKPITPGSPSAPHEDDVVPYYETPETFYMRVLTTRGFTTKQKLDAALAYASWLDFKNIPEAAERMYEWALQLASENTPPTQLPYDQETLVLREGVRKPSANILNSLTAFAVHKARNECVNTALPVLISVLRARRSLPQPTATTVFAEEDRKTPWSFSNVLGTVRSIIAEPAYPAPPDDGEQPPVRDAKELCEEAGVNLYIGEIIYANKTGSSGREDGLSWTREAVDIAEEQLHKLGAESKHKQAKKTCRDCLATGLENWSKMAARLAREEKEKQATTVPKSSWLGLWGDATRPEETGRWAAEENVVKERTRRAQEILDELDAPKAGFWSLFWA
ncbi:uncharacterized protein BCR38DRAFT_427044 [Pseudomassariella vexata]|uniref:MFS maltose permease n=1 Tax=Pseudomassariella vexata TaxID=1141098 RepID=A0A1Y2E781_9PEZI|nr:uncharacterized protein BCR38DRAFT_427044 [Pseudomassariella vexata]ORY67433.1 hypothetical protein BCR38DRAFT_427044 [Pseudomassariella vexata]